MGGRPVASLIVAETFPIMLQGNREGAWPFCQDGMELLTDGSFLYMMSVMLFIAARVAN